MMAGSNIGLFLPVSFSDVGLCVWVGVLTFMSTYAQAVLLVGSQSGEVEVFPYYEERVQITSWSAISAISSVAVTLTAGLVVLADASGTTRLICGLICCGTALFMMTLFPGPYSRARQ